MDIAMRVFGKAHVHVAGLSRPTVADGVPQMQDAQDETDDSDAAVEGDFEPTPVLQLAENGGEGEPEEIIGDENAQAEAASDNDDIAAAALQIEQVADEKNGCRESAWIYAVKKTSENDSAPCQRLEKRAHAVLFALQFVLRQRL